MILNYDEMFWVFFVTSSCWKLNVAHNKWRKVGGFQTGRFRAASVSVGEKMIVLGGRDVDGLDIIGFEVTGFCYPLNKCQI